jgi:peptide/nickel transport system permease protein
MIMSPSQSIQRLAWLRGARRQPLIRWFAAAWLVLLPAAAVIANLTLDSSSTKTSVAILAGPSWEHLMGTDDLGRDVLSRVAIGLGTSLRVAGLGLAIALIVGCLVGAAASVGPRYVDEVLMRTMDALLAFPAIIFALLLSLMLGTGLNILSLLIGVIISAQIARLVRGRLGQELRQGYVLAERAVGAGLTRIVLYHCGRNLKSAVLAYALLIGADAVVFEAALSFLGLGVQPPDPSLGNLILDGQRLIYRGAWWLIVFPGVVLFLTVMALTLLSDVYEDVS